MSEHVEQAREPSEQSREISRDGVNGCTRPGRTWYRLHASTYAAVFLPAAALFLLNVPGQYVTHLTIKGRQQYRHDFGLGQRIEHGWPAVYLIRDTDDKGFEYTRRTAPVWRLNERVVELRSTSLALNAALAILIIGALATLFERRRRQRTRFWQFSVGDLFVCVATFAVGCGCLAWKRYEYHQEQTAIASVLEGEINEQRGSAGGTRSAGQHYVIWQSEVPSWIAAVVQPEELPWFDRVVFANIPPARCEHVQHCKRLKFLRLDELRQYCELADFALFEDLEELELIDLTGGGIASNEVRVERGYVTDEKSDGRFSQAMIHLRSLPKLRGLYLGDSDVSDVALEVIAEFPALEVLDLGGVTGTMISKAGLVHVSRMKKLRALYLKDLRLLHLTDTTAPLLAQIPTLEVLWLSSPQVTDKSLSHLATLPRLRELNLNGTGIAGQELPRLKQLHHLESLTVPKAAEEAAMELRGSLPQLTVTVE